MNPLDAGAILVRAAPRLWRGVDSGRRLDQALRLVPRVLEIAVTEMGTPGPAAWVVHSSIVSSTRVAVVKLGPRDHEPIAVLKVPATRQGAASQRRQATALTGLADTRLGTFAGLLPDGLAAGSVHGQAFTLERALPGVELQRATRNPAARTRALGTAATAIGHLHRCTTRRMLIDEPILDQWIDTRVAIVARASHNSGALERLRNRLRAAWAGRVESLGWVHGDYWLGNVLADPASDAVTGIVDWEWAGDRELPAQDIVYCCLHHRMQAGGREFGDVVAALLNGAGWEPHEQAVLRSAGILAGPEERIPADLLLLVWLRQIAYNLIQDAGMSRNFIWVRRNIDNVLRSL